MKLLIEAVFVGFTVSAFTRVMKLTDLVNTENDILFVFIIGVLLHLIFELFGFNKWYCKNGVACN